MEDKTEALGTIQGVTFLADTETDKNKPPSLSQLYSQLTTALDNEELKKVIGEEERTRLGKLFNQKTIAWIKEQEDRKISVIFPLSSVTVDLPYKNRVSAVQVQGTGETVLSGNMPTVKSLITLINSQTGDRRERALNLIKLRNQRLMKRGNQEFYSIPGFTCTVIAPQGRLADYRFNPKTAPKTKSP